MAALEAATQCARVCGRKRVIGSRTLACWMAGPSPATVKKRGQL